jgi:hypothetical protein
MRISVTVELDISLSDKECGVPYDDAMRSRMVDAAKELVDNALETSANAGYEHELDSITEVSVHSIKSAPTSDPKDALITRWIVKGEVGARVGVGSTLRDLIDACGNRLDKHSTWDILGSPVCELSDGRIVTVNVEAEVVDADPDVYEEDNDEA